MKNMGQKKSNWELVIAHSSLPPKAESKSDDIVPEEKDSFSLYSFFSNLWTKDAPAELNPLLSGKKIGPKQ
jgi:hypothetical protein